jgi:hypothetical protein
MGGSHTQSAGTAEIARDSGGDSMSVDDASALEETLSRIRQRYTLYFNLPDGVRAGQERNIQVDLAPSARLRFRDAEVRYRRVYMTPDGGADATPTMVTRDTPSASADSDPANAAAPSTSQHRVAVNQDGSPVASPAASDSH